jgi:hypothetical protein
LEVEMSELESDEGKRRSITKITGVSRRVVLGSLAGIALGSQKKPLGIQDRQIPYDVYLGDGKSLAHWPVLLTSCNGKGGSRKIVGYVISARQICRTESYGTPEWIKDLRFVDKSTSKADTEAAYTDLNEANDPSVTGCGHISKNVTVTQAVNSGGTWTMAGSNFSYNGATAFYCLVAHGKQKDPSHFIPHEIWISDQQWDSNLAELKAACALKLPASKCPGTIICP